MACFYNVGIVGKSSLVYVTCRTTAGVSLGVASPDDGCADGQASPICRQVDSDCLWVGSVRMTGAATRAIVFVLVRVHVAALGLFVGDPMLANSI